MKQAADSRVGRYAGNIRTNMVWIARRTSTDAAGAGPPPTAGPAKAALRTPPTDTCPNPVDRETDTILHWRLLWSVTSQAHDQLLYVSVSAD